MTVVLAPALAARLRDAARDRRWVHHLECAQFDEADAHCTCDVPDLLADLAALLCPDPATVSEVRRAA